MTKILKMSRGTSSSPMSKFPSSCCLIRLTRSWVRLFGCPFYSTVLNELTFIVDVVVEPNLVQKAKYSVFASELHTLKTVTSGAAGDNCSGGNKCFFWFCFLTRKGFGRCCKQRGSSYIHSFNGPNPCFLSPSNFVHEQISPQNFFF